MTEQDLTQVPFERALDSKDPWKKQQGYPRITKTILIQLVRCDTSIKTALETRLTICLRIAILADTLIQFGHPTNGSNQEHHANMG